MPLLSLQYEKIVVEKPVYLCKNFSAKTVDYLVCASEIVSTSKVGFECCEKMLEISYLITLERASGLGRQSYAAGSR